MKTVTTEHGRSFKLSQEAISKLKKADNARAAQRIFDAFAPHIPWRHRVDVWFATECTR